MISLDVDAVRIFVMVAELSSFTRAADALGSTQATLSVKLRRLEEKLGQRLLQRTPRRVVLSERGAAFLPSAREFLAVHDRALSDLAGAPCRLALGFVDHVASPALAGLVQRLHAQDPSLRLSMRIDTSYILMEALEQGELDAVIVHQEDGGPSDQPLSETRYGWYAAPGFEWCTDTPLRLALPSCASRCPDRRRAISALEGAGVAWDEVFVGGGGSAIYLGVTAGFAATALAHRVAPPELIEIGPRFGLPPLEPSQVALHANGLKPRARRALELLVTAFRERPAVTSAGSAQSVE